MVESEEEKQPRKKKKRPPRSGPQFRPGEYFTDAQLKERWQCSEMKLWRMRKKGLLHSVKIGDTDPNLTAASEVKAIEAAPSSQEAA